MPTEKTLLLKILKEKSVSYGDFVLSSGKRSPYYIDGKLTTFDAQGITLVGNLIYKRIKAFKQTVSAVGGLTMGSDPLVISTIIAAQKAGALLKGFSVRKEPKSHGKRKLIEGNLNPDDRVVVLDDVITTGSSTIKAIDAVKDFGANIIYVIALVDRKEGGVEKIRALGYDVQTFFTIDELIDIEKLYKKEQSNGEYPRFDSLSEKRVLQREYC